MSGFLSELCRRLLIISLLVSPVFSRGEAPRSVCLLVEQDFGEAKGLTLPLERLAKEAMAGAGLKSAPAGTAAESLVIRLHGTPGVRYDTSSRAHYVDASVDGEILAQGPETQPRITFHGEHGPVSSFVTATMQIRPEDAPFAGALSDSDFLEALGRVITSAWGGRPSSIYLEVLKDPEEIYQQAAVRALGGLKDPATSGRLLELLRRTGPYKPGLQLALVEALGTIGDAGAVDALTALVVDPKIWEKTREASARILGRLGNRRASLPLAGALKSTLGWTFQQEIFKALANLGDKRAIGPLAAQLAERNKRKPAFDATLESLEKGYDTDLANALRKLSGEDFGLDGDRWAEWWRLNQKSLLTIP